ncbi:forespore capture DNA-binding protein RefZ [Metabacillus iocasae]|uniref:AcrR family transcriptional regulator n=1 Tax=Priestia iocasae TaxID=2291674 RepID=A0ABS2QP24_9BACI|nr:forespore capture DNA-binding protein RefZ [Metabacillus iocasae]MBM7701196.1 AcrR family transcriptional regulator [Metabacillus iocasae]
MAVKTKTKEKVIDAAVSLFNTKGFDGTSVREIAKKAKVNVANISYYFDGKEGLLESLVTMFFEGYIKEIEKAFQFLDTHSPKECLMLLVRNVLMYQHEHRHIARFVYREISLDTILIREVMTTYLTKEKFYIKTILERGMKERQFRKVQPPFIIVQLKGMLMMPYLHPQYMTEVLHLFAHEPYFVDHYRKEVESWISYTICGENDSSNKVILQLKS